MADSVKNEEVAPQEQVGRDSKFLIISKMKRKAVKLSTNVFSRTLKLLPLQ